MVMKVDLFKKKEIQHLIILKIIRWIMVMSNNEDLINQVIV